MLVDGNGKLAFVGHPSSRKLEEDIDNLVKGEKLTGEGTSGASEEDGVDGDGEVEDQEYKDLDLDKISKDFEQFTDGLKVLDGEEEVKTNAASLMKAIAVLIS